MRTCAASIITSCYATVAAAQPCGNNALFFDRQLANHVYFSKALSCNTMCCGSSCADNCCTYNALPGDPHTLECWFMATEDYSMVAGLNSVVVGRFNSPCQCDQGYAFRYHNYGGSHKLSYVIDHSGCDNSSYIMYPRGTGSINLNQWYHLAGTFSGGTQKFYVDGVLIGTETGETLSFGNEFIMGGKRIFVPACQTCAGGPNNETIDPNCTLSPNYEHRDSFNEGWLDEVRLWSTARTQGSIQLTMSSRLTGLEANLEAYWSFDQTPSQFVQDVLGVFNGVLGTTDSSASDDPYWGAPSTLPFLSCIGDFNGDGGVDGSDVESYFDAWEQGFSSADINCDGGIDGSDAEAFYDVWEEGC